MSSALSHGGAGGFMSLGAAHPSPTAKVCGVGRRQGSFCPPPRASLGGIFGSVTSQGCGVPPPARLRDAGTRQGGPYPWGWCQTPAGCSTRGCRTSCRTRTRWLPARSRDVGCGGLASSPAKPHRLPPETPWDDGHGPPHPACKADGDIRGPWRPISARCTISHCKG